MKPLLKKMIMKWFGLIEGDEAMKQMLVRDLHTGEQLLDSLVLQSSCLIKTG